MGEGEALARQAEQSDWLDRAARVGLVAYGLVHVVVGWLALQFALGDPRRPHRAPARSEKWPSNPSRPRGLMKLMLPLLGPAIRKDFPRQFASFKEFCKSQA